MRHSRPEAPISTTSKSACDSEPGWLELATEVDAPEAAPLEQALLALGAQSVWLEDAGEEPVLEPGPGEMPLWRRMRVAGLFDARLGGPELLAALGQRLSLPQLLGLRVRRIAEQDWQQQWRASLRPLCFGGRLWICPEGQPCPEPAGTVLRLEPGLAFGTGTHPSTALCLDWLAGQPLAGRTLLDYGCGSGILALAALALGASRACATDKDPQALAATRANALRNGMAERIRIFTPEALPSASCDFIVSNILSTTLIEVAPRLQARSRPGTSLALSGILATQAEEVCAAYPWAELAVAARRDDWLLLSGQVRG